MPLLSCTLGKCIITYILPLCPKRKFWGCLVFWKKYIIRLNLEIFLALHNWRPTWWLAPKGLLCELNEKVCFWEKKIKYSGTERLQYAVFTWGWDEAWGPVADLKEHSGIFCSCLSTLQNVHLMSLLHGGWNDWMRGRDLYHIWRSIVAFSISALAFQHYKIFFCYSSVEDMIKPCWRIIIHQFSLFYWAHCGTRNLVLLPLLYKNPDTFVFIVCGLFKYNCLVCL